MRELLLPRTDAGVVIQIVVAAVFFATLFVLSRDRRDVRFLVGALAFVTFALFGLRAAH